MSKEFDNIKDDFLDEDDSFLDAPHGVSEGQDEETETYLDREIKEPEIGKLDAFVQHAAPSASLGFSDVIGGAAGSAGHAYGSLMEKGELPAGQDLLDTYYEAKGDTVKRRDEAMEAQPMASVSGMVAGGFASPLPGAIISKAGKAGKLASKLLPSLKGTDKIAKAGRLAEKAKLVGNLDRFNKLKKVQKTAALALAAKEGTKAGAIYAGTMGESKLLEGDVDGFINDVVSGGVSGGVLSAGFTGGTQVTGALFKKLPFIRNGVDSFKLGSKGIDLDEAEVNHAINKTASKFIKSFDDKLKELKIDKQDALDMVDELGITINTKADLVKAKNLVKGIQSDSHRKKAQQFLDVLDDYLGEGKAYKQAKNGLEKKIAKARYSDPVAEARVKLEKKQLKEAIETGKIPASSDDLGVISSKDILPEGGPEVKSQVKHNIMEEMTPEGRVNTHEMKSQDVPEFRPSSIKRTVDPTSGREVAFFKDLASGKVHAKIGNYKKALNSEKLSIKEAQQLKNLMNEYSALAKKENLPNDVRAAATEAAIKVNEKINGAAAKSGKPIDALNKKISNMLTAKDRVGISREITESDKETAKKTMAKFIAGIGDTNPVSDRNLVIQRLRKVDPKMAEEVAMELDELRRRYDLANKSSGSSNSVNFLSAIWGSVNSVWNKAWNTLGQASSAPFRAVSTAKQATTKSLANKSLAIVDASPAQLQGLITKIKDSGSKSYDLYAKPLQKALTSKPRTKQAIMYGLYQQPSFREMVDVLHTEEQPEE